MKTVLGVAPSAAPAAEKSDKPANEPKAAHAARDAKAIPDTETLNMLDADAPKDKPSAFGVEAAAPKDSARSKLEQIEMLLRKPSDTE